MSRTQNVKNLDEGFLYAVRSQYAGNGLIEGLSIIKQTVNYDAETGAFTVGLTVTGGSSGATGVITAIIDNGATGVLTLDNTTGIFEDDEAITDTSTGAAVVNGVPVAHVVEITRWAGDVFTVADASVVVRAVSSVNGLATDVDIIVAQEIDYTGGTGIFTIGETVTETGSGATGVVVADSGPTTGVLTLSGIVGTFAGTAVLTGGTSGETANGGTYVDRKATFAPGDQPDEGHIVTVAGDALSPVLVIGGADGDKFEILRGLPTYSEDDYVGYVTGKTGENGELTFEARDKGYLQHRKRRADVVRTLSITASYLNDEYGLQALVDQDVILIYERDDDRGGVPTETIVFLQDRINVKPGANEAEGTDISDTTANMRFERAYTLAG